MSPESSLDAAGVARREFNSVRRGCDPDEVRAFVREVAELVEDLERRLATERKRAERAEQLDQHRLIELVGEETARVLDAARDAAAEIRAKAQESAARLVEEGHDERQRIIDRADADAATRKVEILAEAEALRHQAEVELDQRRAEGESLAEELRREAQGERDRLIAEGERERLQGEADAERIRDGARQEGHKLVAEAEAARERVLGDLARRRHAARQQLERLNAARERLLAAYTVVRRTADEATTELTIALPEAKVASDNAMRRARDEPEATLEELEAELSAARLVGLLDSEAPTGDWSEVTGGEPAALDRTPTADADAGGAAEADGSRPADAEADAEMTTVDGSRPAHAAADAEMPTIDPTRPTDTDMVGAAAEVAPVDGTRPADADAGAVGTRPTDTRIPSAAATGGGSGDLAQVEAAPRTDTGLGRPAERGSVEAASLGAESGAPSSGRRGLWPFRRRSPASRSPEPSPGEHVLDPDRHGLPRDPSSPATEPPVDEHDTEPNLHHDPRDPSSPATEPPVDGHVVEPDLYDSDDDLSHYTAAPPADQHASAPVELRTQLDGETVADWDVVADTPVHDEPAPDAGGPEQNLRDVDRDPSHHAVEPLTAEHGTAPETAAVTDTPGHGDEPQARDDPRPVADQAPVDLGPFATTGEADDAVADRPSPDEEGSAGTDGVLSRPPDAADGPPPGGADGTAAGEGTAPAGEDGAPPTGEEPSGARPPALSPLNGAAKDDAPKVVDELFARIKAERDQPQRSSERDVAAARREDEAASTANGAGSPVGPVGSPATPEQRTPFDRRARPSTPSTGAGAGAGEPNADDTDDDPDARWLRHRDAALAAVEATLARRLKRVLADEQNEVLDLVRQAKPGNLDELVPGIGPHVERYASAARPELEAAAAEGAAVVGGAPPTSCAAIAGELGEALVTPMRERIGRSLDESGGDADEVTGRLRSLYRQWKRQRIGEVVHHYAAAAYAAGTFAASSAGAELRWVVDRSGDACPDAEDNALARGVRKGDPFPTGDRCAPAHPGCRCLVVPAASRGTPPA